MTWNLGRWTVEKKFGTWFAEAPAGFTNGKTKSFRTHHGAIQYASCQVFLDRRRARIWR